jgi:hypothetical protein
MRTQTRRQLAKRGVVERIEEGAGEAVQMSAQDVGCRHTPTKRFENAFATNPIAGGRCAARSLGLQNGPRIGRIVLMQMRVGRLQYRIAAAEAARVGGTEAARFWGLGAVAPSACAPAVHSMPTLEEITYEAGRSALADQEALVAGVRQRTGTLLAAHALVASFLGATTVRAQGLDALGWIALVALVLGLVAAAILLAPWRLKFAVDARELYADLYEQASAEAADDTLGWLATAGYSYQALREENAPKVRRMSWLSGALGVLMVVQTLAWLAALAVD